MTDQLHTSSWLHAYSIRSALEQGAGAGSLAGSLRSQPISDSVSQPASHHTLTHLSLRVCLRSPPISTIPHLPPPALDCLPGKARCRCLLRRARAPLPHSDTQQPPAPPLRESAAPLSQPGPPPLLPRVRMHPTSQAEPQQQPRPPARQGRHIAPELQPEPLGEQPAPQGSPKDSKRLPRCDTRQMMPGPCLHLPVSAPGTHRPRLGSLTAARAQVACEGGVGRGDLPCQEAGVREALAPADAVRPQRRRAPLPPCRYERAPAVKGSGDQVCPR